MINALKEDVCFVSLDYNKDLDLAKRKKEPTHRLDYVLPDFTTVMKGFVRTPGTAKEESSKGQVVSLSNERFSVPELLFAPSDAGMCEDSAP